MALDPSLPPSGNFDLVGWRLTLPSGIDKSPDVVPSSRLQSGYRSLYFHTGNDGAMVFRCPVNGVHTAGSKNPRCELREAKRTGGDGVFNWKIGDGTAVLRASLAVQQVSHSGKVVVGQILRNAPTGEHGGPLLEIEFQYSAQTSKADLFAKVRRTPDENLTQTTIASNLALGTKFEFWIQVKPDGGFEFSVDGVSRLTLVLDPSWNTEFLNFQSGAYVDDDNLGLDSEGGQVAFYALSVEHT